MNDTEPNRDWANEISLDYYAFVMKVAVRVAPVPALVEDIAHQAIMEFLAHRDRWKSDCDPKPLLAAITRNVASVQYRRWSQSSPEALGRVAEKLRQRVSDETEKRWTEETTGRLRECLDELPPEARRLIDRFYFRQESHEEIAASENRTIPSVCQGLVRIRKILRRCVNRKASRDDRPSP